MLYLERSLTLQARDRGMAQIFAGQHGRPAKYDEGRGRVAPLVNRVAERARYAETLRTDAAGTDLIFVQIAFSAVAAVAQDGPRLEGRDDAEQLYRRYLWIALDGLRADGHTSELPIPALTTAQTHALLQPTGPDQDIACPDTTGGADLARTALPAGGPPAVAAGRSGRYRRSDGVEEACMPESAFDESALSALGGSLEIDMQTPRRDGSMSHRPIWVVVVGESAYVRSVMGERGAWYRRAARDGRAQVSTDGLTMPVTLVPVADPELNQRISDAYRAKYEAGSPEATAAMVTDQAVGTTLRLGVASAQ